jgi:hypothetical protein
MGDPPLFFLWPTPMEIDVHGLFSGMKPNGSYVVVVWGILTFKWALFTLMSSRRYHKQYMSTEGNVQ